MEQIACKQLHVAPQQPHRPAMVAQSMVGQTQVMMRHDLQGDISEGRSHGEGVLAGLDRAVVVPHLPEISAHIGGDLPQSWLVVEDFSEGCRLAEVVEHLSKFPEYQ